MATKYQPRCATFAFKKGVKKHGRQTGKLRTAREVCFKRAEATPAQQKRKAERAKKALREHACLAKGHPTEACKKLGVKAGAQMRLF